MFPILWRVGLQMVAYWLVTILPLGIAYMARMQSWASIDERSIK